MTKQEWLNRADEWEARAVEHYRKGEVDAGDECMDKAARCREKAANLTERK